MNDKPAQLTSGAYTGVDNLEVMSAAVKYRRFLAKCVADAAGASGPGTALLDFGAGTGTHARDLAALGYAVTCVELDPDLRDLLEHDGFAASSSVAALAGRRFPCVYTLNVLEHIEDDVGALRKLYEATEPKGRIVVYVPAWQCLFTSMDRKVGHLRRYRRRELARLLIDAGFEPVETSYVDSLGFFATLVYKLLGNDRGDIGGRSVGTYDRFVFPVSRVVDRLAHPFFGKNLLAIAERPAKDNL